MKYVLIRDDDVCYFTSPQCLTKLYSSFFDRNKPVNFSVIPQVTTSDKTELSYAPYVPPKFRGSNVSFSVADNSLLVSFLRNRNSYVLQHGFNHELFNGVTSEFKTNDKVTMMKRAELGSNILEGCLNVKPQFFVPPFNAWSMSTLEAMKSRYLGMSIGSFSEHYPFNFAMKNRLKCLLKRNYLFAGDFLIVEQSVSINHLGSERETIFERIKNSVEANKITVLTNHYWQYFFDWQPTINTTHFELWQKIMNYLFSQKDLQFLTFEGLYDLLKRQ